jgi:two-component system capsular synthesis response regulator RcsB
MYAGFQCRSPVNVGTPDPQPCHALILGDRRPQAGLSARVGYSMKWSNQSPLRVALLDDHALIRNGFVQHLTPERDLQVVGVYASSRELLERLRSTHVDVLVLDYSLQQQEVDGLNLIRILKVRFPQVRLLVSSASDTPAIVSLCLRAGAQGFIGKSSEVDELLQAVRTVATEKVYLSPTMAHELGLSTQPLNPASQPDGQAAKGAAPIQSLVNNPLLSAKEQEVLRCCLEGLSVTQIAEKFHRSPKTISTQKQAAMRKLGLRSNMELFKIQQNLEAR